MTCQVKTYSCLVEGLIAVMPEVMTTVLDRGISKSKMSHDSDEYFVGFVTFDRTSPCVVNEKAHQFYMNKAVI